MTSGPQRCGRFWGILGEMPFPRSAPLTLSALVLAGAMAAGCTSGTGALLREMVGADPVLLAPEVTATPSTVDASPLPAASPEAWFTHRSGYAMAVPASWTTAAVNPSQVDQLLEALAGEQPALADAISTALDGSGMRVSMVGADLGSDEPVPPLVVVLSMSTEGLRPGQVTARVGELIAGLPGLDGEVLRSEDPLPNGDTIRYDLRLDDPSTGPVSVRCHLVRFGGHAYVVALASSESDAADVAPVFEAILQSLRFGV